MQIQFYRYIVNNYVHKENEMMLNNNSTRWKAYSKKTATFMLFKENFDLMANLNIFRNNFT